MSRSFKHTPCWSPVCYFSNKKSKQAANRALRAANKSILRRLGTRQTLDTWEDATDPGSDWWYYYAVEDLADSDFKTLREVSDTWNFDSDGLPSWQGVPQWSHTRDWMTDTYTSWDDFMKAVRDRQMIIAPYGLNPYPEFRNYWAKFCHYRWKMK